MKGASSGFEAEPLRTALEAALESESVEPSVAKLIIRHIA